MKNVKLHLGNRSYDIIIGNNIINLLVKSLVRMDIGRDAYCITNALIKDKYALSLSKVLRDAGFCVKFKLVPDTEKSKSVATAFAVINDLARYDLKRKIFIIAFGGGVVGDLAGFVASVYKRGVPYVQIPTTLLAQVDSSIGGKTAIDLIQGKNLVGTFYQPKAVFSDLSFIKTLELRQLRSGLAEVIKYGIIKDLELFVYLEKKYKEILKCNLDALEYIVFRSCRIKAKIVEQDEREVKGIRTVLNFGHTLGHAIEVAGDYRRYNHGEAIGLGMLLATDISKALNLVTHAASLRIENIIKAVGLPARIQKILPEQIMKGFYRDKKFIGSKNRLVLVSGIGVTKIVENVPIEIIKEALTRRAA
jgi:3-dehydroquinate synthase